MIHPEERPRSGHDVPRLTDGISFLYLEHARIDREDQTIVVFDKEGRTPVPVASLNALLLGPGTRITHRAVMSLSDHGCGMVWVGERGVRFYGGGSPINRSSRLAERHATLWANPTSRKRTARLLYLARFPEEKVERLSIAQLRGREGARVKRAYRLASILTGVEWSGRYYDPDDWDASDPVNQALSAATACLYGLCHTVVSVLGLIPSLGFIHTGHRFSFIYDLADLYKVELAIPAAFEAVAEGNPELERVVRRRMRDVFWRTGLLRRMVDDVLTLFAEDLSDAAALNRMRDGRDLLRLWDPDEGEFPSGTNYASDLDDEDM